MKRTLSSREDALRIAGDVRVHYKGGIYRKIDVIPMTSRVRAGERIFVRVDQWPPDAPPVAPTSARAPGGAPAVSGNDADADADGDVVVTGAGVHAVVTDGADAGTLMALYEHLFPHARLCFLRPNAMFEGAVGVADITAEVSGVAIGAPRFARVTRGAD